VENDAEGLRVSASRNMRSSHTEDIVLFNDEIQNENGSIEVDGIAFLGRSWLTRRQPSYLMRL
jgi:hypothetical protein